MLDSDLSRGTSSSNLVSDGCNVGERDGDIAAGSSGIVETSPDSLKNTPSNIARLEDVIENCVARRKYLAQTRSPSDGSDVRWYFCKVPLAENELAAAFPRTEIVGKGEYFRFGMRDSLAIEATFLQREEELLSAWWREFAECSEGPKERTLATSKKNLNTKESACEVDLAAQLYGIEEKERVGVPVKGDLYEVDLVRRHCFPVYWNGENRRVIRGHWFAQKGGLDWFPIREDVAEQLEFAYRSQVWHRRRFQPSGLFAARVDLQGSTPGLHALFTGEDDTWEAWLNVDSSGFSGIIGLSGNGIKLRRGYSTSQSPKPTQDELRQQKEEEMDDYCSQVPVRHLVFMVHGIGQRLEKSNLVDDVTNFRHITADLAEKHLTSYQRGAQRVLFIPCQWRKGLKLSSETAVEKITLDGVRGLRTMLSATVHDVLYYLSPIYCQDIIDSVSNQLNRLYLKFLKRNPGYDGKVSVYGHSLGSVLSYDILCHQDNLSSPFPVESMYKAAEDNLKSPPVCISRVDLERENVHEEIRTTEMLSVDEGKESVGEDLRGARSEECAGDSSGSDESCLTILELQNSEEDVQRLSCDLRSDGLEEAAGRKSANSNKTSEMDSIEDASNDGTYKDEEIIKLKTEIDCLKATIAELQCRRDASTEPHTGVSDNCHPNQLVNSTSTETDGACKSYTPYIKYTKLEFKVDTFFAVGSPLGVFLALRNIRIGIGKGKDYWDEENIIEEMPSCRQMFNIFHPFDPVAYRIEPLVCKEYENMRPVIVPYHLGGKRLHIGFQEFTEDLAARTQAVMDSLSHLRVKVLTVCQSNKDDMVEDGEDDGQEEQGTSYGSLMMQRITDSDEGRIDHVLQDKTFEHAYISAIGAHTNYWRDLDTALFILKHLYRDIPKGPSNGISAPKTDARPSKWLQQLETAADEEEVPLTLSDNSQARNFSRKAKNVIFKKKPDNWK